MRARDEALERDIQQAYLYFEALAQSRRRARGRERERLAPLVDAAWKQVEVLIKRRTPEAVAELERPLLGGGAGVAS